MVHEIIYRNSKWHLVAFTMHCVLRRWTFRIFLFVVLGWVFWASFPSRGANGSMNPSMIAGAIAAALMSAAFAIAMWACSIAAIWFMYSSRNNARVLADHRLSISSEGITAETAVSRQQHSWEGIPGVEQTARYIFIFTQEYAAYVIPLKAFSSPASANAFFADAERLWSAANSRSAVE